MFTLHRLTSLAVAVLVALAALSAQAAPPTLSAINPTSGPTIGNTAVTLTGTDLTGCNSVTFGGTAATGLVVDSDTRVRCLSPAHFSGQVAVQAITSEGTSNPVYFRYADLSSTVIVANLGNPYRNTEFALYENAGQIYPTVEEALVKARELDDLTPVTVIVVENVTTTGQAVPDAYSANIDLVATDRINFEGYPDAVPHYPNRVRLSSNDTGPVLDLNGVGSSVTIKGLSFENGSDGIYAHANSSVTIEQCYFQGNTYGVRVDDEANMMFENCAMVGNTSDGIRVEKTSGPETVTVTLQHCTIKDNDGDGVYVAGTANANVTNTLIVGNTYGIQQAAGGTGTVILSHNNVVDNDTNNFSVGLETLDPAPQTNSPVFLNDPNFWNGKLALSDGNNYLKNADSSLAVDFEGQTRSADTPTIGADELSDQEIPQWIACIITPPSPVGRLEAGQLSVEVWFNGTLAAGDALYIFPQDLLPANAVDINKAIKLTITSTEANGGMYRYVGTNDVPITTNLTDGNNTPGVGDLVADGHGRVYFTYNGNLYDDASGQAAEGRDLLIDTIPPRVTAEVTYPFEAQDLVTLNPAISDDPYAARGVTFGSATHPYPALPATVAQMDPAVDVVRGTVSPILSGLEEDPKIFFNVGSFANGYASENLAPVVTVRFEDPDLFAMYNVGAANERQVSGFNMGPPSTPGDFGTDSGTNVLVNGTSSSIVLPAFWRITQGLPALQDLAVSLDATSAGVSVDPITPALPTTTNKIDATWTFSTDIGTYPVADPLHIQTQFAARDRAGNLGDAATLDPDDVRPPLHIWWNRGTNMQTPVQVTVVPGLFPYIRWGISPSLNLDIQVPTTPPITYLKKYYTYRVWRSLVPGQLAGKAGPYEPITAWSAWDDDDTLDPAAFQVLEYAENNKTPAETLTDHWLLVTVGSVDEAGNVQPWPSGFDPTVSVSGDFGANWAVFFVPGAQVLVDTDLTANIWGVNLAPNPDQNYGPATILQRMVLNQPPTTPLTEPMYEARFDVAAIKSTTDLHNVYVSLAVDGLDVDWDIPNGLTTVQVPDPSRVLLDIECWAGANDTYTMRLTLAGLPPVLFNGMNAARETNFVFRATAKNEATGAFDATPVSYFFTIIPGTMEQYLESSRGEQPVKTHETQ